MILLAGIAGVYEYHKPFIISARECGTHQNVATSYAHNDATLVKQVTEGGRTHILDFNAKMQVIKKTLSTGMNENYLYDGDGRHTSTTVRDSAGTVVGMVTHGFDNANNLVSESGTGAPVGAFILGVVTGL